MSASQNVLLRALSVETARHQASKQNNNPSIFQLRSSCNNTACHLLMLRAGSQVERHDSTQSACDSCSIARAESRTAGNFQATCSADARRKE